jgi:hypothetical protein
VKVSKERMKSLLARGKNRAKSAMSGAKGTVFEGGAGGLVVLADEQLRKVEMIGSRDWASGAVIVAAGHFMKKSRKLANVASALVGAGGLLIGQAIKRKRDASKSAEATTATAAAPAGTNGFDTGYVFQQPEDTGFVVRSGARGT